jgi:hypothetical protein
MEMDSDVHVWRFLVQGHPQPQLNREEKQRIFYLQERRKAPLYLLKMGQ